ncbi:uncharacterized protein LOC111701747 [Eurytemora carolleeae]|uniref:uncharacterized protein LOC111701747 n=1 Tax=Eurytemora carolleeae TaxID=1294199 RepID=UPI000C779940|nr:uncharacterized protein LOC111701747 [Eurytemora carolleeae]|eukprot:XP_023328923.1 uncharacterized protein LOC111701747 [Eurytemora affinis]
MYHSKTKVVEVPVKIEENTEKPVDLEIEIQSRSQVKNHQNHLQIRLSWSPRSNIQDHSRANDSQDDSAEDDSEAVKIESRDESFNEEILKTNACSQENQDQEEVVKMDVDITETKELDEEMDWE